MLWFGLCCLDPRRRGCCRDRHRILGPRLVAVVGCQSVRIWRWGEPFRSPPGFGRLLDGRLVLLLLLGSNHLAPLHRVISSDARLRAAFADADVELPSLGRLSVRGGTLSLPIEPRSGPASFPSVGPL